MPIEELAELILHIDILIHWQICLVGSEGFEPPKSKDS